MDIVGIGEKDQVQHLQNCLDFLNFFLEFNQDQLISYSLSQEAIFRVIAAILHLGNIDFAKGKEIDSSVPKDDKSKFHLKMTAELLMYAQWLHLCWSSYRHLLKKTLSICLPLSLDMVIFSYLIFISGVTLWAQKMHYVNE